MEFFLQKRLIKPTLLTQDSIYTQLQNCKLIITTKLKPSFKLAKQFYQQIINKSVQTECKYIQQDKKHNSLLNISKQIQICSKKRKQFNNEIQSLSKQNNKYIKDVKNCNTDIANKKLMIQQIMNTIQILQNKSLSLRQLISQKQIENAKISTKIEKLKFKFNETIIRQSLTGITTRQKLLATKQEALDDKKQKIKNNIKQIKQIKDNIEVKQIEIKKKQYENGSIESQIQQIERKMQKLNKRMTTQKNEIEQLNKKIKNQKVRKQNQNQKLRKSKLEIQRSRVKNQYLCDSKQSAIEMYLKFKEEQDNILEQVLNLEHLVSIQNEHARRVLELM